MRVIGTTIRQAGLDRMRIRCSYRPGLYLSSVKYGGKSKKSMKSPKCNTLSYLFNKLPKILNKNQKESEKSSDKNPAVVSDRGFFGCSKTLGKTGISFSDNMLVKTYAEVISGLANFESKVMLKVTPAPAREKNLVQSVGYLDTVYHTRSRGRQCRER